MSNLRKTFFANCKLGPRVRTYSRNSERGPLAFTTIITIFAVFFWRFFISVKTTKNFWVYFLSYTKKYEWNLKLAKIKLCMNLTYRRVVVHFGTSDVFYLHSTLVSLLLSSTLVSLLLSSEKTRREKALKLTLPADGLRVSTAIFKKFIFRTDGDTLNLLANNR